MEVLETISGELNNLLPDATHGKKVVVIEKSLHERIVEMFKAGKKKKVIARLLGVGIKTVRKILGGQEWVPYRRASEKEPLLGPFQEWIGHRAPVGEYRSRLKGSHHPSVQVGGDPACALERYSRIGPSGN